MAWASESWQGTTRGPQSSQSDPSSQSANSAPTPPSSQSLSLAYWHVSVHSAPPGFCGGGGAVGGCGGVSGGGGEGPGDGGGGGGLGGSGGTGGNGGENGDAGVRQPPVSCSKPLKSSLFTVPEGKPESASTVARQTMASEISPGVSVG